MKVYIEYGWPEGKWHSKQLVKKLVDSGHGLVDFPSEAEAIVAHSAGCYMLPANSKAKIILLIGLPNWPDRWVVWSTFKKIKLETKNTNWFAKTFFHVVYAFRLPTAIRTWKSFRQKRVHVGQRAKVILIRNTQDTYMHESASRKLANKMGWDYRELPGQHDNIWENPDVYVDMLPAPKTFKVTSP